MFKYLREDIRKVKESDPAATSSLVVLLCYPGVHAVCMHRFEHWLWRHGMRGLARFLSQCTRFFTGIEIHPGAQMGRRVFIDHGMGVIVGETSVVGDDVVMYQGVTLGGTGKETGKRHPNIGNEVVLGVGSAVLGNITIGDRSKVGGGAVVVDNVPEDCTVVGVPGKVVRQNGNRICPADPDRRDLLPDPVEEQLLELQQRLQDLERMLAAKEHAAADQAEVDETVSAPSDGEPGEVLGEVEPLDEAPGEPAATLDEAGEPGEPAATLDELGEPAVVTDQSQPTQPDTPVEAQSSQPEPATPLDLDVPDQPSIHVQIEAIEYFDLNPVPPYQPEAELVSALWITEIVADADFARRFEDNLSDAYLQAGFVRDLNDFLPIESENVTNQ